MLEVKLTVELRQTGDTRTGQEAKCHVRREITVSLFGESAVDHAVKVAGQQIRQAVDDLEITIPPQPQSTDA